MRTLLVFIAILGAMVTAAAQEYEALPYGDLEYLAGAVPGEAAWSVWPRVGEPCATGAWTVERGGAAGGAACVKGSAPGVEFVMGGEGSGRLTASVALRADVAGAQATVRVTWYDRWNPVGETQTVDLGRDWQTVTLSVVPDRSGPCEVAVAPVGDAVIYADDFSLRCAGPPDNERMDDPTPIAHSPIRLAALQDYAGAAAGREGSVNLTLTVPEGAQPPLPYAWGGIPFPKGELFDRRRALVTDAAGTSVPAQLDVLSRWAEDGSIQALLVTVAADAPRVLRLVYGPEVQGAQAEAPAEPAGWPDITTPRVVALDGTEYQEAEEPAWMVEERGGPLARVLAFRIPIGPLVAEMRVTLFADSSRVLVSTTFINEGPAVALKGLGLRLVRAGAAPMLIMTGDGETFSRGGDEISWGIGPQRTTPSFYGVPEGEIPTGVVAVPANGAGLGLALRDFAETRPAGFTVTPEAVTAWAWPPEAGGFVMAQGLACTLDAIIDTAAQAAPAPFRTADLPLLTPSAQWLCDSGAFELLMPPDPETFPIFESTLGSFDTLGRFSVEQKARGNLFGRFDYGDAPGDGGWSNLETMADHEIFLHFFRTLSRAHFDAARLAAEHYRDVDIDHRFGYCHTHCSQHTASGEGWSHAWIQGLRDLYFLTGDGRALAALHEIGERLLTKEPGFATGRDWTRALDNLVDIYQATGDQRYLDAVLAHIRVLGERQDPATGVCGAEKGSWYENRYEAGSAFTWYGCLAMAKLHQNVGGDELRRIFLQELDLSLDVEKKGKAAYVYYPDEEVSEDERAEEIGVYTLGRGSVLFPAIGYAYRLTGDESYLRLGMDVLAYCLLRQRSGSDNSATSFITAFLREARAGGYGPEQEREAFERAREYSWAQYPRELTNGGFEDGFRHWSVKKVPGQDFYWDPVVNVGYYQDHEVAIEGNSSLRIHSDNRLRVISVSGNVALPPGRQWRLTGWLRADETMTPTLSYSLRSYDDDSRGGGALVATDETRDGWTKYQAEFMAPARMVLTINLGNRSGTGDVWFDGFALEDRGELGKLLTENGIGRAGREPSPALLLRTAGTYLPDRPMTGDVEMAGPIPFTQGALTDGDDGYDYSRRPCSYAYWQGRDTGELLIDLQDTYRIDRVTIKVNNDESRRAHGTSRIELLPAEGDEPIAVIDEVANGWNTFDELDLRAQKLRLRLQRMEGRTYITIAEFQIWGDTID